MGTHLYGNNHMTLGLQDQTHPSYQMLRRGSAGAAKFEHLIPPSNPTSLQTMPSSNFFIQDSNQPSLLNKPLHGLMQLPELQTNTDDGANIFNLSFNNSENTANASNATNNLVGSGFLNPNQFNMGEQVALLHHHVVVLINPLRIESTLGAVLRIVMWRTKTMIVSTRGLMNSFAAHGGGSIFSEFNTRLDQNNINGNNFLHHDHQLGASIGDSDNLTLDFLGVGGMVRNMTSGGVINMGSLENPEIKSTHGSQSFGSAKMQ
ncbi:putative zinc finger protein [Tripterygium wilfordii]|uniref:Putative zinc finger protein n=1 Tax=Tripterygium wilfordii TaxID=458696 RepID=A0A7J7CUT5_TRIWF|nr:putative zinc finger protein [Tripterygium wilfordii]